jgi:hypothetical protein
MTIFPPRPPSFTCAICGEFRDWSQGPFFNFRAYAAEYDIPPICRPCEKTWGKGIGGWGDEECEECGGTGDANYDADEYYEDRDND